MWIRRKRRDEEVRQKRNRRESKKKKKKECGYEEKEWAKKKYGGREIEKK